MTTHVLFLSQAPGVGGGERAALSALARAGGVRVTVAAPPPVCAFADGFGLQSIPLELSHASRLTQLPALFFGARRVNALAREHGAEVVYANGTRAIPYAIAARVLGGPLVLFHHHGLLTKGPVSTLVRAVDRWASAIVVPSRASAEPFRPDKVHIVANGIDLDHFAPGGDRTGPRQRWGIGTEDTVIATVTRPARSKGMEPFLDLAARLGDCIFLLAGGPAFPHEEEPYEDIRKRAAGMRNVVLTGRLDDPLAVYHAADVFVHLGESEGFGLTIIEAMACRVPVVLYDWGAARELTDGGRTALLVPPRDLDEAADAVQRLLQDQALRDRLTDTAYAVCRERYSLDRVAADLAAVVRSVAA